MRVLPQLLFITGTVLVLFLSWQPHPQIGLLWFIPQWLARWADAAEHDTIRTGIPFLLMGLTNGWWLSKRTAPWVHWLRTGLLLSFVLLLAELGQLCLPHRSFDWLDLAWGAAGLVAGLGILFTYQELRAWIRRFKLSRLSGK